MLGVHWFRLREELPALDSPTRNSPFRGGLRLRGGSAASPLQTASL